MDPMTLVAVAAYTGFGMVAFASAFVVMVKVTPFSVRKEIEEDQNVALAVVLGSVILGLAHIIASVVHG